MASLAIRHTHDSQPTLFGCLTFLHCTYRWNYAVGLRVNIIAFAIWRQPGQGVERLLNTKHGPSVRLFKMAFRRRRLLPVVTVSSYGPARFSGYYARTRYYW
jgi:hypothetical protein